MRLKFYLIFVISFFISNHFSFSQTYGLGFSGHEVVQDKRTGLDLSPSHPICLEGKFELQFDLSFIPGYSDYFGYIFRAIDDKKRNIDLIYDKRFAENRHFVLVIGDQKSKISFDIPIQRLYKDWHTIILLFDADKNLITLKTNGKSYSQKVPLKKGCYKFLFGANDFEEFKVTDLPPMNVKNVKITEGGKVSYQWDLMEREGIEGEEKINGNNAKVTNPIWISKKHHDWELVEKIKLKGPASVAFDEQTETLCMVGEDSLTNYKLAIRQLTYIPYVTGKHELLRGNQSVFAGSNGLSNFYVDQKLVSTFNTEKRNWSKDYKVPDYITTNWHTNKFYYPKDNSLYIFGGYGQFNYHNTIYRYSFADQSWQTVEVKNNITPRYLSALGLANKGVYILGGYGSVSGEQILNPKNTYDLSFFDPQTKSFTKLFDLKTQNHEFAFANSMVVNEKERSYYALAFSNHKYNSSLQLIKGSLDSSQYIFVGSEIPYTFHDISSFADLYYAPQSRKFIAVTLFYMPETNETLAEIYTLSSPPEPSITTFTASSIEGVVWVIGGLILVLLIAGGFFLFKKRSNRIDQVQDEKIFAKKTGVKEEHEPSVNPVFETTVTNDHLKNAVFLFGNLQLFDSEGEDITKYFTPLIKELFLVVLLHTLRWERGISSEKLTEILWFDKTAESARNNRSVNIAKLKTILDKLEGFQISKDTGYWKIKIDDTKVKVDYKQYLQIVNSKQEINKERVNKLTEIVQRGSFLSTVEYDWLDTFKSEISNKIIDTYLHFASNIKIENDPEFLINLANLIFYFDSVNEEAMVIKCKALVFLGKHSLAKAVFETFSKDYRAIYGEDFGRNFPEVLI